MKAKFFVGDYMKLNESVNSFLEDEGNIRIKKAQMVSTGRTSGIEEAEFVVMIFYVKKKEKD